MISGLRKKVRFIVVVCLFGLLLGLGLGLLPGANSAVTTVEGLRGRLVEPFERDLFKGSRSLGGRVQELQIAWEKIRQYPLLGIGVGNRHYEYTRRVWRYSDSLAFLPWFIHNGYAWIALKMGLPMFFFFLCVLVKVLVLASRNFYTADNKRDRGIAAGLGLSFIGLCTSALVVPVFMQPSHGVTFMAVVGLIAAFRRLSLSNEIVGSAR
jgi:O-antigen ligase